MRMRTITVVVAMAAAAVATGAAAVPASAAEAPAIIGGGNVSAKDYPWMIALYGSDHKFHCGGELIAPDKVLTAGHCTGNVEAVQGRDDVTKGGGTSYKVIRHDRNPHFKQVGDPKGDDIKWGDVGVLTLDRPVRGVQPIGFVKQGETGPYAAGTAAQILGWGKDKSGKIGHLKKAGVPIVSEAQCKQAYGKDFDAREIVCAGNWSAGGVDACSNDSGGPLLVGGRVAGIVSAGRGCAQAHNPGTYARLASYADWVRAR
ncbi:S1 family peptidase [Amycolatopsis sp. NPDC059021]|uniref:S1 family peptidase n=1 Tax=Amycolatopsis sp. NPDC059021 TaxID=3346704 RepID=UPI00366D6371